MTSLLPGRSETGGSLSVQRIDEIQSIKEAEVGKSIASAIQPNEDPISYIGEAPNDILLAIFSAALYQESSPSITISHVCRRWRELAITTPTLWARIIVAPDVEGHPRLREGEAEVLSQEGLALQEQKIKLWKRRLQGVWERAATYLNRSGNSPIDLTFKSSEYDASPYAAEIHHLHTALVDLLQPTAHRWQHVDFDVSILQDTSSLARLVKAAPGSVSNVKSARLKVESGGLSFAIYFLPGMNLPVDKFGTPLVTTVGALQSRSLTDLTIVGTPKQIIWSIPAPWQTLCRLSISAGWSPLPFSQLDALTVFANCPKLVECDIEFHERRVLFPVVSHEAPEPLPGPSVTTLPDLRILKLWGKIPRVQGLPSKLILDSLTNLTIDHSYHASPWDEARSVHVEWISGHGAKLTTVTIDYASLTPSALLHCLERLPNVVSLKLIGPKRGYHGAAFLDEKLLAHLTPRFDGTGSELIETCLCPGLRKIHCIMGSEERNEKVFLEMVLARYGDGSKKMRGPVRRIEEVVLDYNRHGSVDMAKELERCGVDTFHLAMKASYKDA